MVLQSGEAEPVVAAAAWPVQKPVVEARFGSRFLGAARGGYGGGQNAVGARRGHQRPPPSPNSALAFGAVLDYEYVTGFPQISQRNTMPDEPTLLTIKQTAALLKVSERTVYAMAQSGRLAGAVKVGGSWRVVRSKLLAWLDMESTGDPTPNETP